LEYKFESETSTGFALPLYTSSLPTPLLQLSSPSPIDSPPHYNMSQISLHKVIQQQEEQLAAIQAQIQVLLAAAGGAGAGSTEMGSNM